MNTSRYLDPQTQALLDAVAQSGAAPTHQMTPTKAREVYRARRASLQPNPLPVGEVRDLECPGPSGSIQLRMYRPTEDTSAAAPPALVYFHGGGYVIGDLETHDSLCRALCLQAQCVVIAVDYRLAPEHVYPAAINDCLAAARWVSAQSAELGIDPNRLAVGGDSAGGQLAASVSIACRDDADINLSFQLLIYPITDALMQSDSIERNGQGYMLGKKDLAYYYDHYFAGKDVRHEPMASPLHEPNLAGLPPALVLTAGFDPLHDEGLAYANALSKAGNKTQYVSFARQIHGFVPMGGVIDESLLAIATCAAALKRALHSETV